MRVVLAPGWGLPLQHARPFARPAPAPTPSLGPVAVVGPRPMEPLRPGCPGPLYASAELRPPGSSEPQKGGQQPLGRPRGRRVTPVRRRVGAAGGGAGAADRRGGERGESEGAWRRGGSRSRSWPLLASDCPSPCSMAQVMMAYVPPDEDPDVDGPVDFEPDAWELADLARWDGTTSRPEARRFAFARTGPRDPCDRVCAQARVQ